jgi:Putative auto-transporter adhesin, head GIN domain
MSCGKFSPAIFAIHEGDGKIMVDTRHPGEFHSVDLEGAYSVTIVQGSQSEVRIETDQNLLQDITATIKNGELKISSDGYLRPTKNIAVTITSPNYDAVDIEGSSDVKAATPITSDDLRLDLEGSGSFNMEVHAHRLKSSIEGSGDIKLTGDTHSHSVEIDGAGDLAAGKLTTDTTKVKIDGSGDTSLNVANRLDASIAGSGSVRYTGDVKDVHTNIEGSGSVDRANN